MPGGTAHTAGGRSAHEDENLTYWDVVKQLGPEYYLTFYKRPCVRESQLTAIPSGFVLGALGVILKRKLGLVDCQTRRHDGTSADLHMGYF
jgi:cytochrome c oxidase assembly protein subunit 20